jgi:hypothetical protein
VSAGSRLYRRNGAPHGCSAAKFHERAGVEKLSGGAVPARRSAYKHSASRVGVFTGGGIESGMETGFHLLRRAGYREDFIQEVARLMEYPGPCETGPGEFAYGEEEEVPKRQCRGR